MKSKERIYSIGCLFLILDQVVKLIIKNCLKLNSGFDIIPNFFSIYYVENKGAAFSILGGKRLLLIVISIVVLIILDRYISKSNIKSKLGIISLGMILGGIIGNLIDRVLYGNVIDYLSFNIFNYTAPVFNIADICITVGTLLLVILSFRRDKDGSKSRG